VFRWRISLKLLLQLGVGCLGIESEALVPAGRQAQQVSVAPQYVVGGAARHDAVVGAVPGGGKSARPEQFWVINPDTACEWVLARTNAARAE